MKRQGEAIVESAIISWFILNGWFSFKVSNRAPYSIKLQRFMKPSKKQIPGIPDIHATKLGWPPVWVDAKGSKTTPSRAQLHFQKVYESQGGIVIFAWSLADVVDRLESIAPCKRCGERLRPALKTPNEMICNNCHGAFKKGDVL